MPGSPASQHRLAVVCAFVVSCTLVVSRASAQGAPAPAPAPAPSVEVALAQATAFYEGGDYARCARGFGELLDDPAKAGALGPRAREQARIYQAACLIALGKVDEADDAFRAAVRDNPQMAVPSAIIFPPAVIERFVVVRTELLGEIRRAEEERARLARDAVLAARRRAEAEKQRVAELEELASRETLVVKNSRWLASVPFGVGQFQNRDYFLGSVFLLSEVLLAGTAITAVSVELSMHSQADGGRNLRTGQGDPLSRNIETARLIGQVATGAFVAVALGGVLEAHLSFEPEFEGGTRPRTTPLPKPKTLGSVVPMVAPSPSGLELGIGGFF